MMRLSIPLALLATATLAHADGNTWENKASVVVTVNGHAFHDVHVSNEGGCKLQYELYFLAPEAGYADPKNKVRNHHSFQGRVKFAKGQTVMSERFGNSAAGERVWRFEADTANDGCWGKTPSKVVKLDVIGCRGPACDMGQFD